MMNQQTFILSCVSFAGHGEFIKKKLRESGKRVNDCEIDPYLMYWALMTFMEAQKNGILNNEIHDLELFAAQFEKLFREVEVMDYDSFVQIFSKAVEKGRSIENSDIRH